MKNPLKIGGGSDISVLIVASDCIIIQAGEDSSVVVWTKEIDRLIKTLQKVKEEIAPTKGKK